MLEHSRPSRSRSGFYRCGNYTSPSTGSKGASRRIPYNSSSFSTILDQVLNVQGFYSRYYCAQELSSSTTAPVRTPSTDLAVKDRRTRYTLAENLSQSRHVDRLVSTMASRTSLGCQVLRVRSEVDHRRHDSPRSQMNDLAKTQQDRKESPPRIHVLRWRSTAYKDTVSCHTIPSFISALNSFPAVIFRLL